MDLLPDFSPKRIVCLTEESVETLYLLGEQDRIVGISGFAVRPPGIRKAKPIVSTFIDADIDKIISLQPDLVIGFSDIQAEIAKQLIAKGVTVWINNYRTVDGIFNMIGQLGSLIGRSEKGNDLIHQFRNGIQKIQESEAGKPKPKVYFEEWFDPLISGICWVSELIEMAGGIDIYKEKQNAFLAKDRIIADKNDVVERNPDIILASWCGKKFKKERLVSRQNWNDINAVKDDFVFEIKSSVILQPGPAAITEGIEMIASIINHWHSSKRY
ncbi:MAG TPA: cobalamin-binding protein [Chitinophagaceae bacterium]|jgi:iron complex transport system substrate-binding protein